MRNVTLKVPMVAGLLALAAAPAAYAVDDCSGASNQAAMTECADKALIASDAELNALYKQIQGRLKDDQAASKLLVGAQRPGSPSETPNANSRVRVLPRAPSTR